MYLWEIGESSFVKWKESIPSFAAVQAEMGSIIQSDIMLTKTEDKYQNHLTHRLSIKKKREMIKPESSDQRGRLLKWERKGIRLNDG